MQSSALPAGYRLRPAEPADVPAIDGLIRELAAFEKLSHLLQTTPQALHQHLFGPQPVVQAWVVEQVVEQVVEHGGDAGNAAAIAPVVAFALCFTNYSTFLGRPGLYLEDLYVKPAHRGSGIGRALLRHLAAVAVERGCGRFEWSVLDWNQNAIRFYEGMGASVLPDWRICRATGDALVRMAGA
jgi:GNAT superfamily N-acetyltransferase